MENDLLNIDHYFQKKLSTEEKRAFDDRLANDSLFADEVAFYLSAKAVIREHTLQERHKEWTQQRNQNQPKSPMRWIGVGIAAMLVAVIGFWYFTRMPADTLSQRADKYIEQNLLTLPVKMDASTDSLELGKKYYNNKEYAIALPIFEGVSRNKPGAFELAGVAALQAKKYDLALKYFKILAENQDLLNNKGQFYMALTYLKKGDELKARSIMNEIIKQHLWGTNEVQKFLN